MRLLLIEDYPLLQRSLAKGLREAGYAVDVTGDGEEGLWYARSNHSDVVVLVLMVAGTVVCVLLRRSLVEQLGRALAAETRLLASTVGWDSGKVELDFHELDVAQFRRPTGPAYLELWLSSGEALYRSPSLGGGDLKLGGASGP